MSYHVGDAITVTVDTGQTGDTITAAYALRPDLTTFPFDQSEIGATGVYRITFEVTQVGTWLFKPQSALNPKNYQGAEFDVDPALGASGVSVIADPQNGYVNLADIKLRLDIADENDDATLTAVIAAASRQIDTYCNRVFYQVIGETRSFTADDPGWIEIDDLVSLTSLATDDTGTRTYGTTWSATDYDLGPENAAARGYPSTKVELAPTGTKSFPTLRRGVRITGTWGWPAVPVPIQEATYLIANRLMKRVDAPFGVTGSTAADLGQLMVISRLDPDAVMMLNPYRRFSVGAI